MQQILFLISNFVIILFFACHRPKESLPYYNTPDFTPVFDVDKANIEKRIPHKIADFSFFDQNGSITTDKHIVGKIHVANFFFTNCGDICPVMTKNMRRVSDAFRGRPDVVLLSYSVAPLTDTVEKLNRYAKDNQIKNDNWRLLTGNKAAIYRLARQSYFAEENTGFLKDSTEFLHTEHFILVDKDKRIRGVYNGTLTLEIRQLIRDIHSLLM